MLIERLKAAIRSIPLLHQALLPAVTAARAGRRRFGRDGTQMLREYCSRVPEVADAPFFVKVGANDGLTGDPCSDLLLADARWRGLLIEPVPYLFDRLRRNFHEPDRFTLESIAVGSPPGDASFFYVDARARNEFPDLPAWFDQLGSFDKNHILKHLDGALAPFVVECSVAVRPLSDVLAEHGIRTLHLLHIDAEGHDYEVLKTLDFTRHPTVAVFVEHKHLTAQDRSAMRHLLRTRGYTMYDSGSDLFAVDKTALGGLTRR